MNITLTDENGTVLFTGSQRDTVAVIKYMHVQGGHNLNRVTCTISDTDETLNVDEYLNRFDKTG